MYDQKQKREIDTFLKNVTWLRKCFYLSKKEMAELLGISVWSLNKIERGELPPKLNSITFFRIYEQFGIHPKYQLGVDLSKIKTPIDKNDR